jgi:cytochrome c-type biogenesis protein CcmH/NrfG
VAGQQSAIDVLKLRSNSLIFGGPVPPPYLEAVCAAVDIVASAEYPVLRERLDANVRRAHPDATAVCHGWLEKAIAFDPQCSSAHFQLGLLSEETGAFDAAIAHYRRAAELDPSCLHALTNLAILYSSRGDEPKTREMVQRALQFEVDPDRRRALLHLLDPFEKKLDDKP